MTNDKSKGHTPFKVTWITQATAVAEIRHAEDTGIPFLVATVHGKGPEAEDNAKRLVACYNGCAGLNPEAYPDVVEALEIIREMVERAHPADDVTDEVAAVSRLALKKARGEA